MADQQNYPKKSANCDAHQSTKKKRGKHTALADFMEKIHSVEMLYLVAGVCQIALGLSVVTVSILGLIHPLWISILLSIVASVTVMTGLYLCYQPIAGREKDNLVRDAMRRIVEDQN